MVSTLCEKVKNFKISCDGPQEIKKCAQYSRKQAKNEGQSAPRPSRSDPQIRRQDSYKIRNHLIGNFFFIDHFTIPAVSFLFKKVHTTFLPFDQPRNSTYLKRIFKFSYHMQPKNFFTKQRYTKMSQGFQLVYIQVSHGFTTKKWFAVIFPYEIVRAKQGKIWSCEKKFFLGRYQNFSYE